MSIRCFYLPQGLIIGDMTDVIDGKMVIRNPALVIARSNEVALAPLLYLVEEKEIRIEFKDIAFGVTFTPKRDLENNYNKIFGSGLVLTTAMPGA